MKMGLVQTRIIWEDKKGNIDSLKAIVKDMHSQGTDFLLFPEMSFTGFSMNVKDTGDEQRETLSEISRIALDYDVSIGFGWVEKIDNKYRNKYSIVSNDGSVIVQYEKIHPFSFSGEDRFFEGGNDIYIFSINDINMSVFICYDLRFPEIFRGVAKDVDAVIVPANWPKKRADHWKTLLRARAIENQIYIFAINCVGEIGGIEYSGDSCVIAPDGEILKELSEIEGIIEYDFINDVESYRKKFPVLNDIRDMSDLNIINLTGGETDV